MRILHSLWNLVVDLASLVGEVFLLALPWMLLILWFAWFLFAVNWRKAFYNLRQGAWVPLVLLTLLSAIVWSQVAPASCGCLGFITLPNFWWQLLAVSLLVGSALLTGWLQTAVFHFHPLEINLDPPSAETHHHHSGDH